LGNPSCSCTTGRGKGNRVEAVKCRTVTRPSFRSTPTPFPIWRLKNQLNKKKRKSKSIGKMPDVEHIISNPSNGATKMYSGD
jgi:hypothetical protein